MDLKIFKETFDAILKTYVDDKTTQAKTILSDQRLNAYVDYIQNFIFSWWKRIRPYCLWLMYKWFGGQQEKDIMQFAIIFELLHSMALIHDDIIDQSAKRHNVSTMHTYISSLLGTGKEHIAEGQAILIWDLMLSWVYELGNKHHNFSEKLLDEARQNVHTMIEEVILWQMIDVDMMAGDSASHSLIEKKNYLKTWSYTFIRPMLTWAILADADQQQKNLIIELGKYLWLAFQLRDDMMDITFWDFTKTPFSDIQEWQQTYFTNYITTKGTEEQKDILLNAMWKTLSEQEIKNLQNIFEESWAIISWKELLQKYTKQAIEVLEKISFKDMVAHQWIIALIQKIANV